MGTGLVHAAGGILQKYRAQSWWKRGVSSAQRTKVTSFPSWRLPQVGQLSHTWELPTFMPTKANQLSLKSFILEGVSLLLLQMEEGYKTKVLQETELLQLVLKYGIALLVTLRTKPQ